jgi:hypothetical protein
MLAIIGGLVLIIAGVVLWLGNISLEHALAIFMVIVGVVVLLAGWLPGRYLHR